jgi:monoamine oxidase
LARTDFDVVVVGAGLAGLHAAATLEAAAARVLVLEAQARVGGRIHSMRQHGGTAEAGGTYIGAGYTRVIAAAERHGVELMDVTPILEFFREQDLALDGRIIRQSEWATHPANDFPIRDRHHLPWNYHRVLTMRDNPLAAPGEWLEPKHAALDVSAHAWLRSLGLSERAIALAYGLNVSFGRDAHDVSALLLLFRGAFSKEQRAHAAAATLGFTARHGVQRLPEAMAAALQHLELEHAVSAIDLERDRAVVRCANGRRFSAGRVIAAVPPPVLRRIALEPSLPVLQAEAVARLPSQPLTQVYLAPRSRFWEQDGCAASLFTDTRAGMLAAARNRDRPTEVTSFAAWISGDNAAALDRMPSPADAGRAVIAAIETLRPAAKGQLELIGLHSWGGDAYAGGAWSYFRPGDVTRYAAVLGNAHGRVHFAGEHLATANRGMEGAMESAERAAAQVLAAS